MKKYLFIILLALVSLGGQAKKQKQLVILHTNDTHSAIFPINPQLPDTMKAGRGGFLRRIAMLKEERKKNPDLIYFDSGDFWQGSAYFTMFKGEVEIGLMNQMGVEASTIGNHEFDFGLENMAQMFRKANFPILCANYDFTGTAMEGITKPWIRKYLPEAIDYLPGKMAEAINALWLTNKSAFGFRENAEPFDYYGESIDHSPIWVRPISLGYCNIYKRTNIIQIVGHSHVPTITEDGNAIFVDCLGTRAKSKRITLE